MVQAGPMSWKDRSCFNKSTSLGGQSLFQLSSRTATGQQKCCSAKPCLPLEAEGCEVCEADAGEVNDELGGGDARARHGAVGGELGAQSVRLGDLA